MRRSGVKKAVAGTLAIMPGEAQVFVPQ